MIVIIILLVINIIGDIQTLFNANLTESIWSKYSISWLSYAALIFFMVLAGYLVYAFIKRKKAGYKWAKIYFIAVIAYAVLAFILLFLSQDLTNQALVKYATEAEVTPEIINSTISLVNKLTFFVLLVTIALYSYVLYYLSKKKEYFSEA